MKSIIKEAASIAKAVEQCWIAAGKPANFSIKVLEKPERNFLGLTTRSAKVALIIGDILEKKDKHHHNKLYKITESKKRSTVKKNAPIEKQEKKTPKKPQPIENKRPSDAPATEKPRREQRARQIQPQWTEAMVTYTQAWLDKTLKTAGKNSILFSIEPQGQYLRITLNKMVLPDPAQEKHLLASLSTLIIESLKRHFKKPLRGHKVVLTHKDGK